MSSCEFSYEYNSGFVAYLTGEQAMSISGSIPSDLKSINSQDILRPDDGTAQLEKIKQEIAEGEQSMDCGEAIGK